MIGTPSTEHLAQAHIIIAHNAGFDRPFIDRSAEVSATKVWGCSLKHVDLAAKGLTSQKLEILSIYHGFFTDAHRALSDVNALTFLLSHRDDKTGRTYFNELIENARQPFTRMFATYAPFESKDLLKRRGYSWDTAQRVWIKSIFTSTSPQKRRGLKIRSTAVSSRARHKTSPSPTTSRAANDTLGENVAV